MADRSSDPDHDIVRWQWDLGDGRTVEGRDPALRYQDDIRYRDDGSYTITLTVTDSTGNQATKQDTILVANAAPEVSVDAATGKAGEPVWIHLWAWDPGEADNGSLHYHLQVGPAEFKEDRVVGVLDVKVPGLPSGVHKAS